MTPAYAVAFLALAGLAAAAAVVGWDALGWPALAFGWVSAAFVLLAAAYAGAGQPFGKRPDGRLGLGGRLRFAPYLVLNAVTFRLYRAASRGPAFAPVSPNLFFGRRLTDREARAAAASHGWVSVLDLAAEFAEAPALRGLPGYRSLPVLDGAAPSGQDVRDAVDWLRAAVAAGPVYVHCALGHGRTGCVVVAYLLAAGVVSSAAEGVRRLRALRPGVRLNRSQWRAVRAAR
ncbi:MAG: hypothetical protein C0501_00270 [Isosphaera sp.]|nr:hypothetical protein [Isosphaera sp.]